MRKQVPFILLALLGVVTFVFWARTEDLPFDWKAFHSARYGFAFQYPPSWDATCCQINGPVSPTSEYVLTIADPMTVRGNPDAPFAGLAVYVDPNPLHESFTEYLNHEEDDLYALRMGLGWRTFPIDTRTALLPQTGVTANLVLGGRQGMLLKNFMDDDISRIYIPFPDDQRILIVATRLRIHAEWDGELERIFETFRFEEN